MVKLRHLLLITAALTLAVTANAQSDAPALERITPEQQDDSIMSTHPMAAAPAPVAAPQAAVPMILPFQKLQAPAPIVAAPNQAPVPVIAPMQAAAPLPTKSPFGRGEAGKMATEGAAIPSGPHATTAVPVVGVDAVEATDAAPPTPVAAGADPVAEDPAMPTDLTSPIFGEDPEPAMPRKIVIRALNKVTAQSELMAIKQGDTVKFGQLEITAVTCRTSSPESQTDYAGLLDISEKTTVKDNVKHLFHGWMYASSPSITALEHPVYDVTMVECKMAIPTVKKEEKEPEKPTKKGKK